MTDTANEDTFTLTVEEWKSLYRFLSLMEDDFFQTFVTFNAFTGGKDDLPILEVAVKAFKKMLKQVVKLIRETLDTDMLVEHAPAIALVVAMSDDGGPETGFIPEDFMPSKELIDKLLGEHFERRRNDIDDELVGNLPEGLTDTPVEPAPSDS